MLYALLALFALLTLLLLLQVNVHVCYKDGTPAVYLKILFFKKSIYSEEIPQPEKPKKRKPAKKKRRKNIYIPDTLSFARVQRFRRRCNDRACQETFYQNFKNSYRSKK